MTTTTGREQRPDRYPGQPADRGRLVHTGWRRFVHCPELRLPHLPHRGRPHLPQLRPGPRRWFGRLRHRPSRRGLLVTTAVVVLLLVAGVAVAWFTPLTDVKSVSVVGAGRLDDGQVLAAAQVPRDRPLARIDTQAIARRIEALPPVESAQVHRLWPNRLLIDVHERVAVAYAVTAGGFELLDAGGTAFAAAPTPPAGLSKIVLGPVTRSASAGPAPGPGRAAIRAAITVAVSLPAAVRAITVSVSAGTPEDVRLALAKGRTVIWGSATDNAAKGRILPTLLTRPGTSYDVSGLPTVVVR
ncbi:MAG: cell division protein FtsQ/DivIB [Mycobacteriales bacterium]|nr:MAG: cell division protein [Pseudonocardiales bacterium]PZS26519.1 MAG: cell division protein [Pseudonocardiales bacterium]